MVEFSWFSTPGTGDVYFRFTLTVNNIVAVVRPGPFVNLHKSIYY